MGAKLFSIWAEQGALFCIGVRKSGRDRFLHGYFWANPDFFFFFAFFDEIPKYTSFLKIPERLLKNIGGLLENGWF